MTLPNSHFFVRTLKDADPRNPGAHPRVAVKLQNGHAFVAACSLEDRPSRLEARRTLGEKILRGDGVPLSPLSTLESVLSAAGVHRKARKLLDLVRGDVAFERALEG